MTTGSGSFGSATAAAWLPTCPLLQPASANDKARPNPTALSIDAIATSLPEAFTLPCPRRVRFDEARRAFDEPEPHRLAASILDQACRRPFAATPLRALLHALAVINHRLARQVRPGIVEDVEVQHGTESVTQFGDRTDIGSAAAADQKVGARRAETVAPDLGSELQHD